MKTFASLAALALFALTNPARACVAVSGAATLTGMLAKVDVGLGVGQEAWILSLDAPLCVPGRPEAALVQLQLPGNLTKPAGRLVGLAVDATGTVAPAPAGAPTALILATNAIGRAQAEAAPFGDSDPLPGRPGLRRR